MPPDLLNIATDHECFDGIQTVTLRKRDGTTDSVAYVTRGPIPITRLAVIGGGIAPEDETIDFSLPASLCAFAPAGGMTITDASSVVWRVLDVARKSLGARYSCACVRDQMANAVPLQPAELAASVSGTSVTLDWRNPNHGTTVTWTLEYSTSSTFSGASTATGTSSAEGPTTTLTLFQPRSTYYFRVKHATALGDSAWSDTVTATTGNAGLVAHYAFASNVNDSSGYANHGTLAGTATASSGLQIGAGGNSGATIPDSVSLSMTAAFTLAARFTTTAGGTLIVKRKAANWNSPYCDYLMRLDGTNGYLQGAAGDAGQTGTGTTQLYDGTEHVGVVTWDGTTLKGYADGVEEFSTTPVAVTVGDSSQPVEIGFNLYAAEDLPSGAEVAAVKIFDTCLTAAEVAALSI